MTLFCRLVGLLGAWFDSLDKSKMNSHAYRQREIARLAHAVELECRAYFEALHANDL